MTKAGEEFLALPEWLQELWQLSPKLARQAEVALASQPTTEGLTLDLTHIWRQSCGTGRLLDEEAVFDAIRDQLPNVKVIV